MTRRQSAHLKKGFLASFAEHGNVSHACRVVGIERRLVYQWQEHDEKFLAAYRDAEISARDAIDAEIYRRGVTGVVEPVYQGKEHVGDIRKFSDVLLIFLAKGLMPEKYKDRAEVTHQGSVIKTYAAEAWDAV